MNHSCALRGVAGFLLLLTITPRTPADPVSWSYEWGSSPQVISGSSNSFLVLPFSGSNPTTSGTQTVTGAVLGVSSASSGSPDTIGATPYTLTMTLFDQSNGQQAPVTIQGQLWGTLWKGGAALTNALSSPTTQAVLVGGDLFHVTLESFGPPVASGNNTMTLFTFQVDPPAAAQAVPEPSSLLLGLCGVPFFLAAARRRYGALAAASA